MAEHLIWKCKYIKKVFFPKTILITYDIKLFRNTVDITSWFLLPLTAMKMKL